MREDFLDPLPARGNHATLLFGTFPIDCYIVETTNEGFRVAVPNVEQYEGDPRIVLATDQGVCPVRLVRQVRHAGGYSYLLERIASETSDDEEEFDEPPAISRWWSTAPFALAIVALAVIGWLSGPAWNDGICLLRNRVRDAEVLGWWGVAAKTDQAIPAKILDPSEPEISRRTIQNVNQSPESSPSIVAPASLTAPGHSPDAELPAIPPLNPQPTSQRHRRSASHDQGAILKSHLRAGRTGRIQTIDGTTVPWLLGTANSNFSISIKGSAAALADLKQFEVGLRELSSDESKAAVGKLQRALSELISDNVAPQSVSEMPDVSMIAAGEANIYFRVVRGRKELVRVLPQELN